VINDLLRMGAEAGVIGFMAVAVFLLCCVAALAVIGLAGAIARWLGIGGDDKDD